MATLRMHRLIDRWSPSVVFLFLLIKFLQLLRKFRFAKKEVGWRKITRVYLRTEHSKFILACFDLNFWPEPRQEIGKDIDLKSNKIYIINKLIEFFKQQHEIHWKIEWDRFAAKRVKKELVDIVLAGFNEDGCLISIIPFFDSSEKTDNINNGLKYSITQRVIETYNKTRLIDDRIRPLILKKQLNKWIRTQFGYNSDKIQTAAKAYIERILSATFIHFEEIMFQAGLDYRRFESPLFIKHKHFGFGLLNIICRFDLGRKKVDLWFQCNHIPIDGLPMQEVLQKIKDKWSNNNKLVFPASSRYEESMPQLTSTNNGLDGVYCISRIISFRTFLKIEKGLNKQYMNQSKRPITPLRLLIWKLGNHPEFLGKKFLIPVEIPSRDNYERTLGFVLVRPSIYFKENSPERGFSKFQEEFNYQVKTTIARKSENYELFESYALLPPIMYSIALKILPSAIKEFVGSIGITILNNSDLFITPFSDIHTDAFISISNLFIPTEDKDIGCYVSVKGPKNRIKNYLNAIKEIATAPA